MSVRTRWKKHIQECELSYADGNRKYQGQRGVTLSKV